jgi:hypothetical protein
MSTGRVQRKHIPREEIIQACRDFHAGRAPTPDIVLAGKYPVKVIMARMQQMVEEGILNYGVSLQTAWVREDRVGVREKQNEPVGSHRLPV